MRLAHLALLFVCISFPMYMIGYTSPLRGLYGQQGNTSIDIQTFITQNISNNLFNPSFIAGSLLLIVGTLFLSGFSAVFAIPLILFCLMINFVMIPSVAVWNGACSQQIASSALCLPEQAQIALSLFLNLLVLLGFAEYVRGGG